MLENGKTCRFHEARNVHIAEIDVKIAEHQLMIESLQEARESLLARFETASGKSEKALKDLCDEVKSMKVSLRVDAARVEEREKKKDVNPRNTQDEVESALSHEPIGWLNAGVKKGLSNPVIWILFGWFMIKTFIFKEYPAFLKGILGG